MQHVFDILGVVFGVLGLVGVVQIIYSVIHAQLPGQQFCELDEVMKETETLFMSSLEKGLIKDPQELRVQLQQYVSAMGGLRHSSNDVFVSAVFNS